MNQIHTFAQISPGELGAIFAILAGMLAGFYALLKFVLKQHQAIVDKDRDERIALAAAIKDMADPEKNGNERVATALERQADESKERNGHLADISVENKNQILTAINGLTINKQTVHHQTVENEIVKNKEKKL